MRALFVYGTLLDDARRASVLGGLPRPGDVVGATLDGFRRVCARNRSYPVLIRARGVTTEGLLILRISGRGWRRLLAYEGPEYRLVRVRVRRQGRTVPAHIFLPRTLGATRREWVPS